jgi:hypothetical protein
MIELWQNPVFSKKESQRISKLMEKKWQDPEFRKKQSVSRSNAANKRWQNEEYKKNQTEAIRRAHRKEISSLGEFLTDIRNAKYGKDLCKKYKMCLKTINARIREVLELFRIENFTEAKEFLQKNEKNFC